MRGPAYLRQLYAVLVRTGIALQIQYRASNVIWMLGGIVEPMIYLAVWSAVATSQGGETGGWAQADFAAYYVVLIAVNHWTFAWVMHTFQFRIQEGELSFALLRPIHPIHSDIADNLSFKIVMTAVLIPGIAIVALSFGPRFEQTTLASMGLFVVALVGGFAARFLFEWSLALAAFWTTRVSAINNIYFTLLLFLSGRVAPIEMLPEGLQQLSLALPFYWMVAFPVGVFLGRIPTDQALWGFAAQGVWIAIASATLALMWRRAVSRYSAVGG